MSTRVFIVRPFGVQQGIDFEEVERTLIRPALARISAVAPEGGTTKEIVEQGNIREDLFRELVTADLVIADVSIHNANVFYELGIRHGLRPHATFLLRANIHAFPFDLQTDRYLAYDRDNPAEKVTDLALALKATIDSRRVDSPVYQMLPALSPPDPAALRVVPQNFREQAERARESLQRGDLGLLAEEARTLPWAVDGLRTLGRAQFNLKALRGAGETFEWLREHRPNDVEANQRLATIYQRLAREMSSPEYLVLSNQAIQRVIDSPIPAPSDRAEAYALKARNLKIRWHEAFKSKSADTASTAALQAPELKESLESYASAFGQDLNHFYSGLNALSLLRIRIDLAAALPDVWAGSFDTDDEAQEDLDACRTWFEQLAGAVRLSVEASRSALDRQSQPDEDKQLWTEITAADLAFLIGTRPRAVAQRYREALAGAPAFAVSSVRDQLEIFGQLNVRHQFVKEALAVIDDLQRSGDPDATVAVAVPPSAPGRVLLFTGHMIDTPGRPEPRFPPTAAAEEKARRMIREAVVEEHARGPEPVIGIAGGASGGDILFHEVCAELGVETRLFLALPPGRFCAESVQHAGPHWVERFYTLCERLKPRVLSDTTELPTWLRGRKGYDIWQRTNLWMLFNALSLDARILALIALWDQGPTDGPGGTEDLVHQVKSRGCKIVLLPAEHLKSLRDV